MNQPSIRRSFPSLTLLQTYGGITFYLVNRDEIDAYLRRGEAKFAALALESRAANSLLYARLDAAKHAAAR